MSDIKHILALNTYGTQRKTHQGHRVSALKISYSGPIARILLALLPEARDISSERDRYVYIHIPNKPKLHHNWLLVELSVAGLQRVETILREQDSSRGIALWRESQWQYLPYRDHPDYQLAHKTYNVPKGSPVDVADETESEGRRVIDFNPLLNAEILAIETDVATAPIQKATQADGHHTHALANLVVSDDELDAILSDIVPFNDPYSDYLATFAVQELGAEVRPDSVTHPTRIIKPQIQTGRQIPLHRNGNFHQGESKRRRKKHKLDLMAVPDDLSSDGNLPPEVVSEAPQQQARLF